MPIDVIDTLKRKDQVDGGPVLPVVDASQVSNLPSAGGFKGDYNPTTNLPALSSSSGNAGDYYRVSAKNVVVTKTYSAITDSAVLDLEDATGVVVGMKVAGAGIPANATVTAVDAANYAAILSVAVTLAVGVPVTFISRPLGASVGPFFPGQTLRRSIDAWVLEQGAASTEALREGGENLFFSEPRVFNAKIPATYVSPASASATGRFVANNSLIGAIGLLDYYTRTNATRLLSITRDWLQTGSVIYNGVINIGSGEIKIIFSDTLISTTGITPKGTVAIRVAAAAVTNPNANGRVNISGGGLLINEQSSIDAYVGEFLVILYIPAAGPAPAYFDVVERISSDGYGNASRHGPLNSSVVDFAAWGMQTTSVSIAIAFGNSINLVAGRTVTVRMVVNNNSTLTLHPSWKRVGPATSSPTLTAGTVLLVLRCFGPSDADVVAELILQS